MYHMINVSKQIYIVSLLLPPNSEVSRIQPNQNIFQSISISRLEISKAETWGYKSRLKCSQWNSLKLPINIRQAFPSPIPGHKSPCFFSRTFTFDRSDGDVDSIYIRKEPTVINKCWISLYTFGHHNLKLLTNWRLHGTPCLPGRMLWGMDKEAWFVESGGKTRMGLNNICFQIFGYLDKVDIHPNSRRQR